MAEALVVDVVRGVALAPLTLVALEPAVRALGAAAAVGDLPQRHGRAHEGEDHESCGVGGKHRLVEGVEMNTPSEVAETHQS